MIDNATMGVNLIPGTFPTSKVVIEMFEQNPQPGGFTSDKFNSGKVNSMWYAYKDAVNNKGYTPWPQGSSDVVNYVADKSKQGIAQTRLFFMALNGLIERGQISPWYLNFDKEQAPALPRIINTFKEGIKDTRNALKWLTLAGVAGFIIYGAYQGTRQKKR